MTDPILVVMAAGLGSRYGGLKQIEPVTEAGEIILDFSVYDAWKAGFQKVVFIIKEEMEEDFIERVVKPIEKYIEVEHVFQDINDLPEGYSVPEGRTRPWGTCHAVMAAAKHISAPFAVINADDYYSKDAFVKVRDFLLSNEGDNEYCMAGYYIENTLSEQGTVTRGICKTDSAGYLTNIEETKNIGWQPDGTISSSQSSEPIEIGTVASMNFWGFKPSMIDHIVGRFPNFLNQAFAENPLNAEYLLPIEVGNLLKADKISVKVLEATDKWYGITYKEDKHKVHQALESMKKQGEYPTKLWM